MKNSYHQRKAINTFVHLIKINPVRKKYIFLFLVFVSAFAQAQKLKKEDKLLLTNLQHHIQFLADDQLEGRRTGTQGEQKAADYIRSQFKQIGLLPKGSTDYYQTFDINEGKQLNPATYLTIDGKNLSLNKDFFPLVISPNITMEG